MTIEELKRDCEGLVDVVGGLMTIKELNYELTNLMLHRTPEMVAVIIERNKNSKYRATIYIKKEDFERYGKKD